MHTSTLYVLNEKTPPTSDAKSPTLIGDLQTFSLFSNPTNFGKKSPTFYYFLSKKLPKFVENLTRDVYKFIQNSPNTGDYKEFQEYVDIEPHKLLKPAQTLRLSLLPVVKRLLEQLRTLKLYFQNAWLNDKIKDAEPILHDCLNPLTELYLQFLNFVLPFFHDLNKEMQSSQPKFYVFYDRIYATYKSILECFIKPKYIELSTEEVDDNDYIKTKILKLDYKNEKYYLPNDEIYFGGNIIKLFNTPAFINNLSDEEKITFRTNCLQFYIEGMNQIVMRFPFDSVQVKKIKAMKFINPQEMLTGKSINSIVTAAILFPGFRTDNLTELDRQWRLLRNFSLPFSPKEDINVDDFWRYIANIKNSNGCHSFPLVCEFVKNILTLPHSSANVERLFSYIHI